VLGWLTEDQLRPILQLTVAEQHRAHLCSVKNAVDIWSINLETAQFEHAEEGYTLFDHIHRFFGAYLNFVVVTGTFTLYLDFDREVDLNFKLSTVGEAESLKRCHLTHKLFFSTCF